MVDFQLCLKIYLQSFFLYPHLCSVLSNIQKNPASLCFISAILWKLNAIMRVKIIFGPSLRSGWSPSLYYKNDPLLLISNEGIIQVSTMTYQCSRKSLPASPLNSGHCWYRLLWNTHFDTLWNRQYLSNPVCKNEQAWLHEQAHFPD